MRDSFVATITDCLAEDEQVVLLTGDLGFGIFNEIFERFPERMINVGVAEQNMIGVGSGLSLMGKKVFCYSIANFSFMRGLEQFRNGAVYHGANVTLVCSGGGFTYGQLGFTHFAIEDYGILSAFPDVEILHPATSEQVRRCTRECVHLPGPKYLRLEKAELDDPVIDTFGARDGLVSHRAGTGGTALIAVGSLLEVAMSAAEAATESLSVYSLVRHRALGEDAVRAELARFDKIITLEEHVLPNSAGQKMLALHLPVEPMGITDSGPSIVGDQQFLRAHYGLTVEGILSRL